MYFSLNRTATLPDQEGSPSCETLGSQPDPVTFESLDNSEENLVSSSSDSQSLRISHRESKFSKRFSDFVIEGKCKYRIEKSVNYSFFEF